MNYLDEEVVLNLKELNIKFSIFPETDHDKIVDRINNTTPFSGSQIAWEKLKTSINFSSDTSTDSLLRPTKEIKKTSTRTLYFVGDTCSKAYSIDRDSLSEVLKIFSELPQHTYIVPDPMAWIACLSFEGDIDFADLFVEVPYKQTQQFKSGDR